MPSMLVSAISSIWSGLMLPGVQFSTATGCSGRPRARPRSSAALLNTLVITVTAGLLRFSVSIPSWRPHVMQDPQKAMAWMMASQLDDISSNTSGGVGKLWLAYR